MAPDQNQSVRPGIVRRITLLSVLPDGRLMTAAFAAREVDS